MSKQTVKKILSHPDREEIISKIVLDYAPKDIFSWLKSKYQNVSEAKFVLSERSIKQFKDNYLDVYSLIQEDISKTKTAVALNLEDNLDLAVKNNPTYKSRMMELAKKEIDVRQMVAQLCIAVETRLGQVFDQIQENPQDINTRVDRIFLEYAETLGNILEKYYKFTESPADLVVQHNFTLQAVDQHILVFYEAIREVLSQLDLESSMMFMEIFNEKMNKLKAPDKNNINTDMKVAEAKILNETINKKLNE